MPIDHRINDAVLSICQNNRLKSVTISDINDKAEALIGLVAVEIVGKSLNDILPPRIAELLTEYVEFEDDANDVGIVLSKVQNFSIIGGDGIEKTYRIKLSRIESMGDSMFFSLMLQDALGNRKNEAVRKIIQANFKGHESLDPQTNLPSRSSLIKDISIIKNHSNTSEILACFAVLQIDGYEKFLAENGRSVCNELFKHVASVAKRSLRPDDVVGVVGDGRIGVLLVDIATDSERLAFNRLRWQIASNPYIGIDKNPIGMSVSISFCGVSSDRGDRQILEQCELALGALKAGSQNILVDASA
ncbi:MAG: diguanylate cyclase [Rickettsiales bacterium]|jgi:GGDEF domain-containing protein